MAVTRPLAPVLRLAVAAAGLATGLLTLAISRHADTASWAGRGLPADALLLIVGWLVMAAGLRLTGHSGTRTRSANEASGVLLTAGGFAWFIGDWNNQAAGSPSVFTTGLVFSTVAPALIGHALLRYRGRRLDVFGRIALLAGYLSTTLLAGWAPALWFDPARQGCSGCAANLLALQSNSSVVDTLGRAGVLAGPVWCALLIIAISGQLAKSEARRRLSAPALIPGIAYLFAVGATYVEASGAGYIDVSPTTRTLWAVQGCVLALVAAGTFWPLVDRRLTRARMTRIVVATAAAPPVGGLSSLLAGSLRDPSLRVLYRAADGAMVDSLGRPAEPSTGQTLTRLVRSGETVALVAHRPGLLDDPNLATEIGETAQLVLDNDRLQAQNRAQLEDLQASRARIVESGDRERRQLEHDLHDGAQQRLVALSLALQLAAIRRSGSAAETTKLARARTEVAAALADLRLLARGIFPRELADEGLAAALETLAEGSPIPVEIESVPPRRFPAPVEAAAFQVVAQSVKTAGAQAVRVIAQQQGDRLTIEVASAAAPADVTVLQDRVGALGGLLELDRIRSGGTVIRAVLPCGW